MFSVKEQNDRVANGQLGLQGPRTAPMGEEPEEQ